MAELGGEFERELGVEDPEYNGGGRSGRDSERARYVEIEVRSVDAEGRSEIGARTCG